MWWIETTDLFDSWFDALEDTDRANVLASLLVLRETGPMLSRPYADTVKGSRHSNMKELRIQSKGDPIRAFLHSILSEKELSCAPAIRPVMKNVFTR